MKCEITPSPFLSILVADLRRQDHRMALMVNKNTDGEFLPEY